MDVYAEVTNSIVAAIEQNPGNPVLPWVKSSNGLPKNATTGNEYQGINILQLWASATIQSFTTSEWASYKQWQAKGAQVAKGARSTVIVFYKELPREDEDTDKRFVLRYSRVFNAEQVEGYQPATVPSYGPVERHEAADLAIQATGITLKEHGERACYIPRLDEVHIPDAWRFFDTGTSSREEGYYSTIFHELTHATGHKSRLDRDLKGRFGDESYAMEELVAELGAAFCCVRLGITPEPRADHAKYLANWLQVLKNDKKAIFTAAAKAQQATDYLL